MSVEEGCIRWGGDLRRGRSSFGVNVRLCGIVILCCEGGDGDFPKLFWDFLFHVTYDDGLTVVEN